jgi:hypothetical protein
MTGGARKHIKESLPMLLALKYLQVIDLVFFSDLIVVSNSLRLRQPQRLH